MNNMRLKLLEEKYWQGETSLEEENELKSAALNGEEGLSPEFTDLVKSLREDDEAPSLDSSFDDAFWAAVNEKEDPKIIKRNFTPLHMVRYAAAAVVLLCFSAGIWYALAENDHSEAVATTVVESEFESPEAAFEEAKKALSFASAKMNKAKEPVQKIEKFHQATLSVAGMGTTITVKDSTK
jgi:hypothetical protein